MKKIKLALVGCAGRMGQKIIKELYTFKNIDLVAAIEKKGLSISNKKINISFLPIASNSAKGKKIKIGEKIANNIK